MNVVYNEHMKEPYIIAHVQMDQCIGWGMSDQGWDLGSYWKWLCMRLEVGIVCAAQSNWS